MHDVPLTRCHDLDVTEADDGLVVYVPERRRVHHLNATASLVFELCNGTNSLTEIATVVQRVFALPSAPIDDCASVIDLFLQEGIVS